MLSNNVTTTNSHIPHWLPTTELYDAAVLLHAKDELWSKGKNTNIDGAGAFDAFAQGDMEDVDDAIEAAVRASGVDGEITHIEAEMLAGLFDADDDV